MTYTGPSVLRPTPGRNELKGKPRSRQQDSILEQGMANWLINLNWDWNVQIWTNCRKNGRAAIGWDDSADDDMEEPAFQRALNYLKRMRVGDGIVAFLKDRRVGGWGTVSEEYNPKVREPQFPSGTASSTFGRVVQVHWDEANSPPTAHAARMRPDEVQGFTTRSSIN